MYHDEAAGAVNILSLEAKDAYLANLGSTKENRGYRYVRRAADATSNSSDRYNTRKFKNTLDYSLDLIKIREVYKKIYRRQKGFSFFENGHEYCQQVINMTFEFNVKNYNQLTTGFYVKLGFTANISDLTDNALVVDDELIAIRINQKVASPLPSDILGEHFRYEPESETYQLDATLKTVMTQKDLRREMYRNGFYCEGIHFVRYKRSSGSARVGKCLFVNEALYPKLHKYDLCGLKISEGQPVDLAALESYIALTSSSIIDLLEIDPKSILVIDDYESSFVDKAIITSEKDGHLVSQLQEADMTNSIWDGQSLIDRSLLERYQNKGMVLLRNQFFKSCCFNTNIQQWFRDNRITSISQLRGFTLAEKIEDIKLITTPSSIKYLKFGTLEQWLNQIDNKFGIVKYDKPTHFLDGRLVQVHYQLINTLQLSNDNIKELLKQSLDFKKQLRDNPAVLRYFIKYPTERHLSREPLLNENEIVFNLMNINNNIVHTKYYYRFRSNLIKAFTSNLKCGHVLVNGNYSVLLGNPIEMLQASIGTFEGQTQIGIGNIHSTRFDYDRTLIGSRSPHVTASCVWLPHNTANEMIDRYINLTPQIVCINSIGEPTLSRLSGADFDSDTVLLTDNQILIDAAKKNYDRFAVSVSDVSTTKTQRYYSTEQQADLDIKTSVNKIGEIVNLSQVLNSLYWDRINRGQSPEENFELYCDICTLNVLSGVEIDSAKKEFAFDRAAELQRLRNKYRPVLTDPDTGKQIVPQFFKHILIASGKRDYLDNSNKVFKKFLTPMEFLQTGVKSYYRPESKLPSPLPFGVLLNKEGFHDHNVNKHTIEETINIFQDYKAELALIGAIIEPSNYAERQRLRYEAKYKRNLRLDQLKYNYSTMYKILWLTDKETFKGFSNMVIEAMFEIRHRDFYNVLLQNEERVPVLKEDPEGNIDLYGYKFTEK